MKAVIDTNIWISFLIGKFLAGLDDYIIDGLLEVIISEEQLEEITTVLRRPKFRKHFAGDDIEEFLSLLYKSAQIVEIHHSIKDCRDEKDNFILETAIRGRVDYIVTGDKDLLVLNPYRGKKIIGFRGVENRVRLASMQVALSLYTEGPKCTTASLTPNVSPSKDRCENLGNRLLDYSIHNSGNSEFTDSTAIFGNLHPQNRLRLVSPA